MENHEYGQKKNVPEYRVRELVQKHARRFASFLTCQSERLSAGQKKLVLLAFGLVAAKASLVLVLAPILWSPPVQQGQPPDSLRVERPVIEKPTVHSNSGASAGRRTENVLDSFKLDSPLEWMRMIERRLNGLHTVPGR